MMWKGVYFAHSEYVLQFEIRKLCAFQPKRPLRNGGGRTCLRKECLSPHTLPRAFSEFIIDETKYKSKEH